MTSVTKKWEKFEEAICLHFQSLGADAKLKCTLVGVRSRHKVDVLVKSKFFGQEITWIIEAKLWKSKIPKERVEVLKSIVNETGADRGFIISEVGFQRGAIKAADKTNISLTTFAQLKALTAELIETEILKNYRDRIKLINTRYWSHSKSIRKKYGLRAELPGEFIDLSIAFVLQIAQSAIESAEKREYPVYLETFGYEAYGKPSAENFQQVINWLNINLNVADKKILDAEAKMILDGTFNPKPKSLADEIFYLDDWKTANKLTIDFKEND